MKASQARFPRASWQLFNASRSQIYWRDNLKDCRQTILHSGDRELRSSESPFRFIKEDIPGLSQLENAFQKYDISLLTIILIAFGRGLATKTVIPSPSFGLYQAGGSGNIEDKERQTVPQLNVSPLMIRDIVTQSPKRSIAEVQNDLAARITFAQSYLHEILDAVDLEQKSLFNTFLNVLVKSGQRDHVGTSDELLSPLDIGDAHQVSPNYKVWGKTAVDALATSMLVAGNLFLDVRRCTAEDSLQSKLRYDHSVLNEEEARLFCDSTTQEIKKCIEICASTRENAE